VIRCKDVRPRRQLHDPRACHCGAPLGCPYRQLPLRLEQGDTPRQHTSEYLVPTGSHGGDGRRNRPRVRNQCLSFPRSWRCPTPGVAQGPSQRAIHPRRGIPHGDSYLPTWRPDRRSADLRFLVVVHPAGRRGHVGLHGPERFGG
jgi:hypothetical protein